MDGMSLPFLCASEAIPPLLFCFSSSSRAYRRSGWFVYTPHPSPQIDHFSFPYFRHHRELVEYLGPGSTFPATR